MRRYVSGAWRVLVPIGLLVGLLMVVGSGTAAPTPPRYAIHYHDDGYSTLTQPGTPPTDFQLPSGGTGTGWQPNKKAPFGKDDGGTCPQFDRSASWDASVLPVGTYHSTHVVAYLRKTFHLPADAFGLHVVGTVDNTADVFVNGNPYPEVRNGACQKYGDGNLTPPGGIFDPLDNPATATVPGGIDIKVPNTQLHHGGDNLLAVKVDDYGVISFFDAQATYGQIAFGQQPSETQQGSAISPAPTVTITDADGNPVSGASVAITLQTINGAGSLSGTTTMQTDASGIATFSNLKVSAAGTYRLVADSDGATTTSDAFVIANQVTPCHGKCDASGSAGGTSTSSSTNTANGSLAVSVFSGTAPPDGVCAGLVPLGAGSFVNVLGSGAPFPDLTVTWQLDKSIVKKAGNPGASKFDICLGAEDLADPDGSSATPWKTKSGGDAVGVTDPDFPGIMLFWGVLPDCPKKGTPTGPCVLHRNKTNAGDEVIDFFKPAPWDGRVYGG